MATDATTMDYNIHTVQSNDFRGDYNELYVYGKIAGTNYQGYGYDTNNDPKMREIFNGTLESYAT